MRKTGRSRIYDLKKRARKAPIERSRFIHHYFFDFTKNGAGFTLIETLIYLALFSLLIGGALVAVYGIFESTGRNQTKALVQEEGRFIAAKIDWALSGVKSIDEPTYDGAAHGPPLSLTKYGGGTISMWLTGTDVEIQRNTGPKRVLNNSNVEISNVQFTHTYGGGSNPESLEARFTVKARTALGVEFSEDFFTTKNVRR